jgi:hypothetical protein
MHTGPPFGQRMKITRFIPTADRGSQFVDVDIAFDNGTPDAFGHLIRRSGALPAQSTMLTEMLEGMNQDWRPASRRQFVIGLSGTVEVETGDGQKRCWSSDESFSPTIPAAAATAPRGSAARRACCSSTCRPTRRSAGG